MLQYSRRTEAIALDNRICSVLAWDSAAQGFRNIPMRAVWVKLSLADFDGGHLSTCLSGVLFASLPDGRKGVPPVFTEWS